MLKVDMVAGGEGAGELGKKDKGIEKYKLVVAEYTVPGM